MYKKPPKVAIIGAGASGLSAGYYLAKAGFKVEIFESSPDLGGLGSSYEVAGQPVEKFVHHLFASDIYFKQLIQELELSDKLHFKKSKDAVFVEKKIIPFSSPFDLIRFFPLNFVSRVRTGLMALYLKKTTNYKKFERHTAEKIITKIAGIDSYHKIWEPLIVSKFGNYASKISMAWFWARIYSRTPKLGYLDGGYQEFFFKLSNFIITRGGKIYLNKPVIKIATKKNQKINILTPSGSEEYDYVLVTIPPSVFERITPELQGSKYSKNLKLKEMISATSLNLVLKKSFMKYYWLNIIETDFPFLVLIEHTNLVPSITYKNKTILYIGNYLMHTDVRFTNSKEQNLKLFLPFLKKINPKFSSTWIESITKHNALYAQPIVDTEYSFSIPRAKTPLKNVYLVTMSQVYPFDRGTNYAIRDGKKVAELIIRSSSRK